MLTYSEQMRALTDLESINKRKSRKTFDNDSQAIFMCTDKIPVILNIMGDVKKCMIPTSSGESSIEMAARNIDVYTYDISSVSYYTEQLRIAATLMLEYKDFLSFFYMFESDEILSEKHYEKLRCALEPRAQYLLDKMFSSMSSIEIFDKLYDMLRLCPKFFERPKYYMDIARSMFSVNNEEGFYQAKSVDLQSKIHYAQFDILDLDKSDYKDERDFDIVFFSNILYSLSIDEKILFVHMLDEFYGEYLKHGGALINYFHSMDGLPRHLEFRQAWMDYHNLRSDEMQLLSNLSKEFYEIGEGVNGMGLYQNDIVHLIKRVC
ncbi:MAG: hypothetical protein K2I70_00005 [Bacilli bacterium]|nr:hypothetical protein [Bacilli bacterium]